MFITKLIRRYRLYIFIPTNFVRNVVLTLTVAKYLVGEGITNV
jgi:hypothetical protein